MSPSDLREHLNRTPFEPFRLVMSSGNAYDVGLREHIMVANRYIHLGIPANPGDEIPDRIIRLDLLHVTELQPLGTPDNGVQP